MQVKKRQRTKFNRKKKLLQIAFSCYSGSAERCGDSCNWTLIPDRKNVRFHDRTRGEAATGAGRFDADYCGGRIETEFSCGRIAVAISDGMGKGEMAAGESEKAVNSVLSLLKAGMDEEMALQVLNLLWSMSNRKEMFPTMDLALLDSAGRELVIYKIGAAPTVIVRAPRCRPGSDSHTGGLRKMNLQGLAGKRPQDAEASGTCQTKLRGPVPVCSIPPEHIEILAAPAMPMGVSEYSEIPSISTLVMPGDLIIMMTDGVSDSNRSISGDMDAEKATAICEYPELAWLRRLLTRIKSRNLQTISDLIIREAALNYGAQEKDDMTVVVIRV